MMQTVAMYHSLLPRIVYGNLAVEDALTACEQEFLQEMAEPEGLDGASDESAQLDEVEGAEGALQAETEAATELSELNVNDVLAEITRMFEEPKE